MKKKIRHFEALVTLACMRFLICSSAFGQNISGFVFNEKNQLPVEYVNIGIVGKNTGTVADFSGKYSLSIDPKFAEDTLLFSSIGYIPLSIRVSELIKSKDQNVFLKENIYQLKEVIVHPKIIKQETLGVTSHFKKMSAGFRDNLLGYELGVLMKVKKTATIKRVNINISACTYDSVFYRLNVYKVIGKKQFENILITPIYLNISKDKMYEPIHIDLQTRNIVVEGDFLVTLEHVRDLGKGYLYFPVNLLEKTYFRKTSQGKWETSPVGISISVDADVEK
jgi:hypothetical protein